MTSVRASKTYDDSSDEEDEEEKAILASGPTFGSQRVTSPGNKSSNTVCNASTKNVPTVTQEEEDESDQGTPDEDSAALRELQRKARLEVQSLSLSEVKQIDSIVDLAWHVQPKNGKVDPCRRNCPHSEAIGLPMSKKYEKSNMDLVQYLGQKSKFAGTYSSVAINQLVPILKEDDESHFQTYKERYLKDIKKKLEKGVDPKCSRQRRKLDLDLLFEEYAIEELIKRVQNKQNNPATNEKREEPVSGKVAGQNQQVTTPVKAGKEDEFKVSPTRRTMQSPSADEDSDDGDDSSIDSTNKTARREPLTVGDIIQYDPPISVAGLKGNLRTAEILGIKPRKDEGGINDYPLILSDGEFLSRDMRVKRIRYRRRKEIVDNPSAPFKPIHSYRLAKSGAANSLSVIRERGRRMANALSDGIPEEMKDFCHTFQPKNWRKGGKKTETGEDKVASLDTQQRKKERINSRKSTGSVLKSETRDPSGNKKRRRSQPVVSSATANVKREATSNKEHRWKKHLSDLIEQEKHEMNRSKRYKSHMTIAQLELVLKVWPHLEDMIADHHRKTGKTDRKAPIKELSNAIGADFRFLDKFLRGDEEKMVKKQHLDTIESRLAEWLAQQPNLNSSLRDGSPEAHGDKEVIDGAPSDMKRRRLQESQTRRGGPIESGRGSSVGRRASRSSIVVRKRRASSQSTVQMARASALASASFESSSSTLSLVPATPNKRQGRRGKSISTYEPPSVVNARKRRLRAAGDENEAPKKRRTSVSTVKSEVSDVASTASRRDTKLFDWRRKLPELIEKVEKESVGRTGRYKPHLSEQQLKLLMDVWEEIEQHRSVTKAPFQDIIVDLAVKGGVSHRKMTLFLTADREKSLSEVVIENLCVKLSEWLASRQPNSNHVNGEKKSTQVVGNDES